MRAGERGPLRKLEARLCDEDWNTKTSFAQGEPVGVEVTVEAASRLELTNLVVHLANAEGLLLFAPKPTPIGAEGTLEAGRPVKVRIKLGNPLATGHYFISCAVGGGLEGRPPIAYRKNAADLVVFGTRPFGGLVELDYEAETVDESGDAK